MDLKISFSIQYVVIAARLVLATQPMAIWNFTGWLKDVLKLCFGFEVSYPLWLYIAKYK